MKRKWWHGKIAYQIYPKSFNDTNSDGIGDLPGIIEKLDYLKELGIDIIWLSPCYCSPLADQGYDISDYYAIDPQFGTMEDMDLLIKEAKKRGISVLMDLVANHCSDEHSWFRAACKDPDGKYGSYFYIRDKNPDGSFPTNWRSYFGGPVWEELPGHPDKVYLHLFHKKQPDLNWENPLVREEFYQNINWWLDKGLGGFRIDAIINIKKTPDFHSYPADRIDGLSSIGNMLEEAALLPGKEGIGSFLSELRDRCFTPYDAFSVGEVFAPGNGQLASFLNSENGYFSSMFDFSSHLCGLSPLGWYDRTPVSAQAYKKAVFSAHRSVGDMGFLSNIIENHDEPRGVNAYLPADDINDTSKKMLGALYFFLRGVPFIYQGQELGMENVSFDSIDTYNDVNTKAEYQTALAAGLSPDDALKAVASMSRDNGRVPMQWDSSENAGFTNGTPWLPVNPNYTKINAAAQTSDPDSVFSFYRKMIALRKDPEYFDTFVYGSMIPVGEDHENLMAYVRTGKGESPSVLVIGNYQNAPREIDLSAITSSLGNRAPLMQKILLNNYRTQPSRSGTTIRLESYQILVLS